MYCTFVHLDIFHLLVSIDSNFTQSPNIFSNVSVFLASISLSTTNDVNLLQYANIFLMLSAFCALKLSIDTVSRFEQ